MEGIIDGKRVAFDGISRRAVAVRQHEPFGWVWRIGQTRHRPLSESLERGIAATEQGPRRVARVSSGRIRLGQAAGRSLPRSRRAPCGGFHTEFRFVQPGARVVSPPLDSPTALDPRCRCFQRIPGASRGCRTTSAPPDQQDDALAVYWKGPPAGMAMTAKDTVRARAL